MEEGENPPFGIIICSEKNKEQVELLFLEHNKFKLQNTLRIYLQKNYLLKNYIKRN